MSNDEIKSFAIKQGFQDIKEIGKYKNFDAYVPIFTDGKQRKLGYPQYILVRNEEIILKIDITLEITKDVFPDK